MPRLTATLLNSEARSAQLTESPAPSSRGESLVADSSDKENARTDSGAQKRRSTNMATPEPVQLTRKRRRVEERTQQSQRKRATDNQTDTRYYDPEQAPEERRRIKRGLRDLHSKLNDSRSEYLQANSTGLVETIQAADRYFQEVKQTADATVDSRLLVATADLSFKKISTLTLGDSSVGVDVDDFVTKCISFMKRPERPQNQDASRQAPSGTQSQRRGRQQVDIDDEESGDTLNWEYLGRNACILYNSRPSLSGFLLGPLSVQKKVRQQTQRRAREEREEPTQRSRTLQLTEEELDNQEKQSLTAICGEIYTLLVEAVERNGSSLQEEYDAIEYMPSHDEVYHLMYKHGIADDGGLPLFKFCINPRSFGQTVENLFYVSFLIKEGKAGLGYDSQGMPTIQAAAERPLAERQEKERKQAVFTMSFEMWEEIVQSFGIKESIIPHRESQVYEDGVLEEATRESEHAEDPEMYD
ncbi:uncharacterized protein HMPREF1541_03932 [Cyphellophora europaea CBS 101466]|uniref:Non-structural maintenance of chromosomes element 4 n=1 Tax=Cyphellophora europaea (strain CBS 101466) TaxID=1220924 RepID=W2S1S2_CYPE1|nr:uncharacterized protein HMPREF1541_03932 [Cyphellophora europaea CBS 101466]ETN41993.1 hypothetical protein HMPREF1541_03932 [Cyphellophora europaea CBS 101466]